MNITEQEVLSLISTQRLVNENHQLRDTVVQLQSAMAKLLQEAEEKAEDEQD